MFAEIKLTSIGIEAILGDYLVRGEIQSRGDLVLFLNDRNWSFLSIFNGELFPLYTDRRIGAMKPAITVASKGNLEILSVLAEEDAEKVQATYSKRPVLFILGHFVVQGDLHVSEDAPDEDMLDDMHDFFAVTNGSIFPVRSVATAPTERVPLLFISRPAVQVYRVQEADQRALMSDR